MAEAFEVEIRQMYAAREQEREARRQLASLSHRRGPRYAPSLERFRTSGKYQDRPAAADIAFCVVANRELTAVLDGQQRLTALNIGLRGSMAVKEPNKWRTNPNAFPKKTLHLNLFAQKGEDEEGEAYSFQFRDSETAKNDLDALWYPVASILAVAHVGKLSQWLYGVFNERKISPDSALFNRASDTLHRLYEVVHTAPTVTFYTEKSQDLDRVLRISIRMNSGGTVLSYSDLLLSIAVAQ